MAYLAYLAWYLAGQMLTCRCLWPGLGSAEANFCLGDMHVHGSDGYLAYLSHLPSPPSPPTSLTYLPNLPSLASPPT
eukprot:297450-Rhodomonas_salina.1